MLDWLIIGGGIHGTYLSHYLVHKKGVPRAGVRVLDPHPEPLAQWSHWTNNVGMAYLRSPRVHHLDLSPSSLDHFQAQHPHTYPPLLGDYRRPAYQLFQDHCQYVIDKYKLAELRVCGCATHLNHHSQHWQIDTPTGQLAARRVVLAIGRSTLAIPTWAHALTQCQHIFSPTFDRHAIPSHEGIAIVGGGITAAQIAIQLAQTQQQVVTLIMRHGIRQREFDADAGWLGPKYLDMFKKKNYDRRRILINRARNRGSMPADVVQKLGETVKTGRLKILQDEPLCAEQRGQIHLTLAESAPLQVDRVILATGFARERAGGAWLTHLIQHWGLRCGACGFPLLSRGLEWWSGLYVMGSLAELEIGPAAPNIAGARMAAERLGRTL